MNVWAHFGCFLSMTCFIFFEYPSYCQSNCIEPSFDVFFPNVITPNNDGFNDFFTVAQGDANCRLEIDRVDLVVYNRWGKEVFCYFDSDYEPNELKWYGETEEDDLSESCYYYRAKVSSGPSHRQSYKGWVKVIRENGR